MTDGSRDLACEDLWQQSLERSRERRGARTPARFAIAPRDLTDPEPWGLSTWRSTKRREWRERHLSFGPIDSKRIAVPAALLAGGLAVTEVVTSGGGGTGGGGVLPEDATAASATTEAPAPAKAKPVVEKKAAAKRSAAKRSATKKSA